MGFNPFEEIGKAANGAAQAAGEAAKAVADGANQAAKAAGGAAEQAGKMLNEGVGQAGKAIADGAEQAAKAANDGMAQVGAVAGGGVNQAAKIVGDGAAKLGGAAVDAAVQAKNVLQNNVAPAFQKGAGDAARAANHLATEVKKAFYKPVSREDLESDWFVLPKMIEVVDASEKQPAYVELGAIGWQDKRGKIKVLHIYEDALDVIDREFYPVAASRAGSVYYIDQLNSHRYINLSQYIDVIAGEKRAELLKIAYWLGAKHCYLECREEKRSVLSGNATGKEILRVKGTTSKRTNRTDIGLSRDKYSEAVTIFSQEYGGNDEPQRPELHWYAHDPKILQFIEARCDPTNEIKEYRVEISDTKAVTFDLNVATSIDAALEEMHVNMNFSFGGQVRDEKRRKLTFVVEF